MSGKRLQVLREAIRSIEGWFLGSASDMDPAAGDCVAGNLRLHISLLGRLSKVRSMRKDTDAYYKRWRMNMWTGSSSAINWNMSPTGAYRTWRITAGCRRFILIVSISKLETHGVWSLPCRCFPPPRELRRPDFKGASPGSCRST